MIGTPRFMAPEQFDCSQVDTAADMWSLGATLYTAVEGQTPMPSRAVGVVAAPCAGQTGHHLPVD